MEATTVVVVGMILMDCTNAIHGQPKYDQLFTVWALLVVRSCIPLRRDTNKNTEVSEKNVLKGGADPINLNLQHC